MGDYNDAMMRNPNAAVQARTKAQNRANVLQLKLIGQSHPTGLTNNLLKLFEPRPPLEYKPPPEKRKCPPYSGMAQYVGHFAEPGDEEYAPPVQKAETPMQRRARIHKLRLEKGAQKATEELEKYDPHKNPNATGDPYKTLFVARLSYETTEHRIKREFEAYGPIKRVVVHLTWRSSTPLKVRQIMDKETNKPRGYAFIEYLHTRDMKTAYKQADGRKLDNRRVLVDVERGRTVPNWRPRRLGGGLGSTRVGGEEFNQKHSGREQQQAASGRPRSEEPRAREERHLDRERERSRDRGGRDRDRQEKSRERSHDKTRDKDPREDRHHHRDRDRNRERERDKERDHGRDRDRGRDRERDYSRDFERRPRDRERDHTRERERDRDYERASHDKDRGYADERDAEYDHVDVAHERDRQGIKVRETDHSDPNRSREYFDGSVKHGHDENEYGQYYQQKDKQYDHEPEYYDHGHYGKEGGADYQGQYKRAESEPPEEGEAPRDHDYEYHRSERSLSREYRH